MLCVSAGGHSVLCTTEGTFTFGSGQDGRLGHGDQHDERVPRRVEGLRCIEVVMASAGGAHTVMCTRQGQVFTFGAGNYGQLGHGDLEPGGLLNQMNQNGIFSTVPRRVDSLEGKRVVCVAGGVSHTAALTDAGVLYTCGYGLDGQLGHGDDDNKWAPQLVKALVDTKVVGVSAGTDHTAVCTEASQVLTFGNGGYGRLGHGTDDDEIVPRVVEALAGKAVIGVSAGHDHTAAWTVRGELYTWGFGLALGHDQGGVLNERTPRQVKALAAKKVVGAAAGYNCTGAWTQDGELFTFGNGTGGELGHGCLTDEAVPRLVQALAGRKVVQVDMDGHMIVSTEDGEVYTCGRNDGRLGNGSVPMGLLSLVCISFD